MGYLAKVKDIQPIEYSLDNIGMARVSEVVQPSKTPEKPSDDQTESWHVVLNQASGLKSIFRRS